MRNQVVAALLILVAVVGTGGGYLVASSTHSNSGTCSPFSSLRGPGPAGINLTVSYQGNWRLSMAEFASNQTKANSLDSVCYYEGSGTISFYLPIANYQGWNTVIASAQKEGANGMLTVRAMFGNSRTDSTTTPYGDATITFSFLY